MSQCRSRLDALPYLLRTHGESDAAVASFNEQLRQRLTEHRAFSGSQDAGLESLGLAHLRVCFSVAFLAIKKGGELACKLQRFVGQLHSDLHGQFRAAARASRPLANPARPVRFNSRQTETRRLKTGRGCVWCRVPRRVWPTPHRSGRHRCQSPRSQSTHWFEEIVKRY